MSKPITFGILTVCDSSFNGRKVDLAGPALCLEVNNTFPCSKIIFQEIVPAVEDTIKEKLLLWCLKGCNVILTTGGTGCWPKDVTPEATKSIIERELPGIVHYMLARSFDDTSKAMLSMPICGIKEKTLILNLPGSVKNAKACFNFITSDIRRAVALINDDLESVTAVHVDLHGDGEPSKVVMASAAFRGRQITYPMKEFDEALRIIIEECSPTNQFETIRIENALHRVLAEDIHAKEPYPPFRASMTDGYAVKRKPGVDQRMVRTSLAAGDQPNNNPLNGDEAIRVSTGAPVPNGADAVVPVENTKVVETSPGGSDKLSMKIEKEPTHDQYIRQKGSLIPANSKVLDSKHVLLAGDIGLLATIGVSQVKVFRRSTVGVLSTGNESRSLHGAMNPGEILDTNKLCIMNVLKQFSYEAQDCGVAKYEPNDIKCALSKALSTHDIVITIGGVSVGEFDLVRMVLVADFGALIHFGKVNMQPGTSTTFATLDFEGKTKILFGFPVSCCMTTLLFVIPCLKYTERRRQYMFPTFSSKVGNVGYNGQIPLYTSAMVRFERGYLVSTQFTHPTTSSINGLGEANGIAVIPANYSSHSGNSNELRTIIIGDLM